MGPKLCGVGAGVCETGETGFGWLPAGETVDVWWCVGLRCWWWTTNCLKREALLALLACAALLGLCIETREPTSCPAACRHFLYVCLSTLLFSLRFDFLLAVGAKLLAGLGFVLGDSWFPLRFFFLDQTDL